MSLIIDGYNLLNSTGISSRGRGPGNLERARQALLNTLAESLTEEEIARTIVVFDASESPWGVARATTHRGITVQFAAKDEDADTVIEQMILARQRPQAADRGVERSSDSAGGQAPPRECSRQRSLV